MPSQIGAEHLRVDAADLQQRLESGEPATVLDARGERAWDESTSRVVGAIRVDEENFQPDPSWPRDRFTVVYSADLHDATSAMVALRLVEEGFTDVHVLRGGFEAWRTSGGPVESK